MANVFALKSGDWNDPTTWDNNLVPSSNDVVFANGYIINVNADVDVNQLRNGSNLGQLANMCIPAMTSNTAPEGIASASGNDSSAFLAFDGNDGTYFTPTLTVAPSPGSPFTLTYKFNTPKTIKRFRILSSYNMTPNAFTVQASDDPAFGTFATIGSGNLNNGNPHSIFISGVLANITPYLYYRLNVTTNLLNFSTPRVHAFEMTESTSIITNGTVATPFAMGGYFNIATLPTLPAERTITVRNTLTGLLNQTPGAIVINSTAPTGLLNINHATLGNLIGGDNAGWQGSVPFISLTAAFTATLNVRGDIIGQTTGWSNRDNSGIQIAGSCTVNYIGNITAGYGDLNSTGNVGILLTTTASLAVVNVTGNLKGQQVLLSTTPGGAAIWSNSTGNSTINVTGNINGYLYPAIQIPSTSNTNVNIITGTLTASNTNNAVRNLGGGIVTLFSPIINANNVAGLMSQRIRFYQTGVSQWRFQNQAGANVTIYSGTGAGMGYPAVDTVRYGSPTFGPTNTEYNGTMRIPDVTNVNKGVEYGYNLVGTAVLTAEDFLDAISTSTNPMAIRLTNLSTTQTMGDQLSGFSNA